MASVPSALKKTAFMTICNNYYQGHTDINQNKHGTRRVESFV
jgi:hypothetical protein